MGDTRAVELYATDVYSAGELGYWNAELYGDWRVL